MTIISKDTTFWGYRRENGRVGVRNHVIILPLDDLSNAAAEAVAQAVAGLRLPAGEGFAWAGGEAASIAAARQALVNRHGLDKARVRASAYWKRGSVGHHAAIEG